MFYSGNITVGTPPQTFVTDFDTGSSDLWVLDGSCKDSDCKHTALFQKGKSSTYKSDNVPEQIKYADQSYVTGVRAFDSVTFGEVSITSQNFILANKSQGNTEIKSIFGLSSQNIAETGTPPFYTAVKQKVVDKPILTVFLEKSKDDTFGGDITFGDYDTKNCDPVYAKTNSTDDGDWFVSTNSVSINGKKVYKEPFTSIIDTGTSFIVLPFDIKPIINAIKKKVKLQNTGGGDHLLKCKDAHKIPALTINIDGHDHKVDGAQLALPVGKGLCVLALDGSPSPEAILGDPFIRDRCVSQNIETKEVSFALRK